MGVIDIENESYYEYDKPKVRTKERLVQIKEVGMEEVGIASFGIPDVMSGLYIEKVWGYSEKQWNDYIEWAVELKKTKKEANEKKQQSTS